MSTLTLSQFLPIALTTREAGVGVIDSPTPPANRSNPLSVGLSHVWDEFASWKTVAYASGGLVAGLMRGTQNFTLPVKILIQQRTMGPSAFERLCYQIIFGAAVSFVAGIVESSIRNQDIRGFIPVSYVFADGMDAAFAGILGASCASPGLFFRPAFGLPISLLTGTLGAMMVSFS